MTRFIMPIILIGIAVTVFFLFTNPVYNDVTMERARVAAYSGALDNSKALESERDKLTAKYNSINPEDILKLEKLLPENVDNIRLILEIEQIAAPYGMTLQDVRYNAVEETTRTGGPVVSSNSNQGSADYGVFDLEFAVSGNYDDFISFTKDLESNLRIVDIASLTFSSDGGPGIRGGADSEEYRYSLKIRTYWLKD